MAGSTGGAAAERDGEQKRYRQFAPASISAPHSAKRMWSPLTQTTRGVING